MSQPNAELPAGSTPLRASAPLRAEPPAATPSKLTGTRLLLIILGILAGCGVALAGAIGLATALGWKLFEALR